MVCWRRLLMVFVWSLAVSSGEAFGFSTHNVVVSREFDAVTTRVDEPVHVTLTLANMESHRLRGFYYAEHIPPGLTVETGSVRIDGDEILDYLFESGAVGSVYPESRVVRWVFETPTHYAQSHPVPPAATVEIAYALRAGAEGEFRLDEFHWVGYFEDAQEGEKAAFGFSDSEDQEVVQVWEDCLCQDLDGDGFGDPACDACPSPEPDCDDSDADVHPGAEERCDGRDNQCNGEIGHCRIDEGCDFEMLRPSDGHFTVEPAALEWAAGDYHLFGVYLVASIFREYYSIPIWGGCTTLELSDYPNLWAYTDPGVWSGWVVLGIDLISYDWEIIGPRWFQKED